MPRTKANKKVKDKKSINIARVLIIIMVIGIITGMLAGVGLFVHASQDLPEVYDLKERLSATSFLYNADGSEMIAALHDVENRIVISLDEMPVHLQNAVIATEDERFRTHFGVDIRGLFRAVTSNLTSGDLTGQGGSTLTMQLARNAYLTQKKFIYRKVQEWILAVRIERVYTKNDILEMYMNQVFLGYNAYGVEAAANHYFGKSAHELSLAESAMLAGITKSPNYYSPHSNFAGAKTRQEVTLKLMVRNGLITQEEADAAKNEELAIVPIRNRKYNHPYFVDYVLRQLLAKYGADAVYRGGLKIYTTIDLAMQEEAELAFTEILDKTFPPKDGVYAPQAALISIDPNTGYIKALVGGRNHDTLMGLNRVVATRQPGSAFKPVVVFAPAIARGYGPGTIIEDAPITLRVGSSRWSPKNYNSRYVGPISLREAAARSINTVAVRLIDFLGVNNAIASIKNLGITTLELTNPKVNDTGPAIALGGLTRGVTPLELNSAYGVFATNGKLAEPISILKVVDRNGIVLEENTPKLRQVLDPAVAYLVTNMLKDTIGQPYGTGYRNANIGRPAAGKTGTTNDDRDAWFVGYTPNLVTTVWLGHDRDKTMVGVYGGSYPARIWARVMRVGHKGISAKDFAVPKGVVTATICKVSGHLPGPNCPTTSIGSEYFLKDHVPTQICNVHTTAEICEITGQLAGPYCQYRILKSFVFWSEEWGFSKPYGSQDFPTTACTLHTAPPPTPTPTPTPMPTPTPIPSPTPTPPAENGNGKN